MHWSIFLWSALNARRKNEMSSVLWLIDVTFCIILRLRLRLNITTNIKKTKTLNQS